MKGKSKRASAKSNAVFQQTNSAEAEKAEVKDQKELSSLKEEMVLQFGENEVAIATISEKVKKDYKDSGKEAELTEIKIYIKPEDNKAYYVANGDIEGSVDLV